MGFHSTRNCFAFFISIIIPNPTWWNPSSLFEYSISFSIQSPIISSRYHPSHVLTELFYLYCSYVSYLVCIVTSNWFPSTWIFSVVLGIGVQHRWLFSSFVLYAFLVSVIMSTLLCLVISHGKIHWTSEGGLSFDVFFPLPHITVIKRHRRLVFYLCHSATEAFQGTLNVEVWRDLLAEVWH